LSQDQEVTAGQETFFANKFEGTLEAFGMNVNVHSEQVRVGKKRSRVKTIVITSVGNDTKNNDCCDQWDDDSRCRNTIRTAKKWFNSAKRSAASTSASTSAENERNTRSRTVSESSLLDSCSTADSSPATTDDEGATIASSTSEQRESASISNEYTALEVHVYMEIDDVPLPNPQSWAEKSTEDANKLDFSLERNGGVEENRGGAQEMPQLSCAMLDDKYRALLTSWIS
jgi:hypothetical protein